MVELLADPELWRAGIRLAVPILLAAIGVLLAERSGVLNIGIEGCMLAGAAVGSIAAVGSGSPIVGLVAGSLAGGGVAIGLAVATVWLPASQVAVGIAINLLLLGGSLLLVQLALGTSGVVRSLAMAPLPLPLLGEIPIVGRIAFDHDPVVYLAGALVVAAWWVLFRTDLGIRLRAVGDSVHASRAIGLPVARIRFASLWLSGLLGGLGGAYLSVIQLTFFVENTVAGRGYVALALVIFGGWHPLRIAGAALLLGSLDALQLRLQGIYGSAWFELLSAIPYAAILLLLVARPGRLRPPRELGRPLV